MGEKSTEFSQLSAYPLLAEKEGYSALMGIYPFGRNNKTKIKKSFVRVTLGIQSGGRTEEIQNLKCKMINIRKQ